MMMMMGGKNTNKKSILIENTTAPSLPQPKNIDEFSSGRPNWQEINKVNMLRFFINALMFSGDWQDT